MIKNRFAAWAWTTLGLNVLVILWGAFVRATGSGAGCGRHWPSCKGQILPRSNQAETLIEFTHRMTSGLALIFVLVLLIWAFRAYPRGHRLRKGAVYSAVFIIIEALVGAGLVLFELVAQNDSLARAIVIALHLANTFFLLAALVLTAWWASGGAGLSLRGRSGELTLFALGFGGVLALGMSGAITALGDTLFPIGSLAAGIQQDLNPASHFLIRLRVIHPLIAMAVGAYLVVIAVYVILKYQDVLSRRLAGILLVLFIAQLLVGAINLALLAPVTLQIIHLLMADLVWITMILLSAVIFRSLGEPLVLQEAPAEGARLASGGHISP